MKKRILSSLLAAILLFAIAPSSNAASSKTLSINREHIKQVGYQTSSGPCGAYALAYCRTILDGYVHYYTEYYIDGWSQWHRGSYVNGYYPSEKIDGYRFLHSEIEKGKPVIIKVPGLGGYDHYVAVVGYENVNSLDLLSANNFLILDPNNSMLSIENLGLKGLDLQVDSNGCYQIVYDESNKIATFGNGTTVGTSGAPQVEVPSGVYTIHSAWDDNQVLDISGDSKELRANIQLYPEKETEADSFRIIKKDGYYSIQSIWSEKWLDIHLPYQDYANVQLWDDCSSIEEQWVFEDAGDGYVYIRSMTGYYLDVYGDQAVNNANIQIYHFVGNKSQKWRLEDVTSYANVPDGIYTIHSALDNNYVLDITGDSKELRANIQLYPENKTEADCFEVTKKNGYYIIQSMWSEKWLDIHLPYGDNANVQLWNDCSSLEEKWTFEDAGNGYMYIASLTGYYLDVQGDKAVNNANIQVYHFDGCDSQKWKLLRVESGKSTTNLNADNASEVNLPKQTVYFQDQFTDVPANQWYTNNVAGAFELGLMKGNSSTTFNPYGDVTIAEAITMASRIHNIYTNGSENIRRANSGEAWYKPYLDYAYDNGIIRAALYNSNVSQKANRAQFAEIFANALPNEALSAINSVTDNAIPDVKTSESYASYVYKLYRAGILGGSDANGTFHPTTYITRAEAATIVARMGVSTNRINISLG